MWCRLLCIGALGLIRSSIGIECGFVLFLLICGGTLLRICVLSEGRGDHIRGLHLRQLTVHTRIAYHRSRSTDNVAYDVQCNLLCIGIGGTGCFAIAMGTTSKIAFFVAVGSGRSEALIHCLVPTVLRTLSTQKK